MMFTRNWSKQIRGFWSTHWKLHNGIRKVQEWGRNLPCWNSSGVGNDNSKVSVFVPFLLLFVFTASSSTFCFEIFDSFSSMFSIFWVWILLRCAFWVLLILFVIVGWLLLDGFVVLSYWWRWGSLWRLRFCQIFGNWMIIKWWRIEIGSKMNLVMWSSIEMLWKGLCLSKSLKRNNDIK